MKALSYWRVEMYLTTRSSILESRRMRERTFYKLTLVICRSTALDWTVLPSYKKYKIKGVSSPTVRWQVGLPERNTQKMSPDNSIQFVLNLFHRLHTQLLFCQLNSIQVKYFQYFQYLLNKCMNCCDYFNFEMINRVLTPIIPEVMLNF